MKRIKSLAFMLIPALLITLSACSDGGSGSGNSSTGGTTSAPTSLTLVSSSNMSMVANKDVIAIEVDVEPPTADQSLTYESLHPTIATVSDTGVVTGLAVGDATIVIKSAIDESLSVEVIVRITSIGVTDISATSNSMTLLSGATSSSPIVVTFSPNNASDKRLTYNSMDNATATVDSDGYVTAGAAGSTEIVIASVDNPNATAIVNVEVTDTAIALNSITLSLSPASIEMDEFSQASVTYNPNDTTQTGVTYTSENHLIASVNLNTGVIEGQAAGSTYIVAKSTHDNSITARAEITVTEPVVALESITLSLSPTSIEVGESSIARVTYYPDQENLRGVTYTSENHLIASIDPNTGEIEGQSAGSTHIVATSTIDGSITSRAEITVTDPVVVTNCANPPALGYDNVSGTWEIYNATGLVAFGSAVNNGDTDLNAKLVCNIVLAGDDSNQWAPIGSSSNQYSGTFDGDNHTISGLYINNTNLIFAGMFNYVSGGTIKNLGIVNADITIYGDIGGIVFEASANTLISNVYVKDSTFESTASYDGRSVGSIVTRLNSSTIMGSYVDNIDITTMEDGEEVGGLVAQMFGTSSIYASYANDVRVRFTLTKPIFGGIAGAVSNESLIEGTFVTNLSLAGVNLSSYSGIVPSRGNAIVEGNYYVSANSANNAIGDEPSHATTQRINSIQALNDGIDDLNNVLADDASVPFHFDKGINEATDIPTIASGKVPSRKDPRCANTSGVGYDDNSGTWEIYNTNGLVAFRDAVNSGSRNRNVRLVCDINLAGNNSNQWTPIAYDASYHPGNYDDVTYTGTFDGDNYTISGLFINDDTLDYIGLFGAINEVGTVKNLIISGANVTGNQNVGALAGINKLGTVDNVSVIGGTVSGSYSIGGIVGDNRGLIATTFNSSNVEATHDTIGSVGGIVGSNDDTGVVIESSNAGNITGKQNVGGIVGGGYGAITSSYNEGNVTGTTYESDIGGIMGDGSSVTITACYNAGAISGLNEPDASGSTGSIGGIIGTNYQGTVIASYNIGTTTGHYNKGGLVGYNSGRGEISSYVIASYNMGSMVSKGSAGGIIGRADISKSLATYFLETIAEFGIGLSELNTGAEPVADIQALNNKVNNMNTEIGKYETDNDVTVGYRWQVGSPSNSAIPTLIRN